MTTPRPLGTPGLGLPKRTKAHDLHAGVRRRSRWHRVASALIGAWLVCGIVAWGRYALGQVSWWSALHVLTIGVILTAIIVYSTHFTEALTRTGRSSYRGVALRVLLAQLGLVVLLAGDPSGPWRWREALGAVLVVAGVTWQVVAVAMMRKRSLSARPVVSTVAYLAGGACLLLAIAAAGAAGAGVGHASALLAAHSVLAVWGFVVLTVLGTIITLLPTLSGTSISQQALRRCQGCVVVHSAALVQAAAFDAIGIPKAAGLWLFVVVAAEIAVVYPVAIGSGVLRAGRRQSSTLGVLAGLGWFVLLTTLHAAGHLVTEPRVVMQALLGPLLAGGLIQIVLAVLQYLLPTLTAPNPVAAAQGRRSAQAFGRVRLMLVNLGAALLLFGLVVPGAMLAAAGHAWSLVALAIAVGRRRVIG